jgi:hypothetical protein
LYHERLARPGRTTVFVAPEGFPPGAGCFIIKKPLGDVKPISRALGEQVFLSRPANIGLANRW